MSSGHSPETPETPECPRNSWWTRRLLGHSQRPGHSSESPGRADTPGTLFIQFSVSTPPAERLPGHSRSPGDSSETPGPTETPRTLRYARAVSGRAESLLGHSVSRRRAAGDSWETPGSPRRLPGHSANRAATLFAKKSECLLTPQCRPLLFVLRACSSSPNPSSKGWIVSTRAWYAPTRPFSRVLWRVLGVVGPYGTTLLGHW